jgi:signal transduction histidine kinase
MSARRPLASLRSRVFFGSAALALLPILAALQVVSRRAAVQAEAELRQGVREAASLAAQQYEARLQTIRERARLVADLPKLKAAVATGDPPTVRPLARDYRERLEADALIVVDRRGRVLAALGTEQDLAPAIGDGGVASVSFDVHGGRLLAIVTEPLLIEAVPPELLGTLSLGFAIDDSFAARLRSLSGSEIAFAYGGRIHASTLPRAELQALAEIARSTDVRAVRLAGEEHLALARPLGPGAPTALVLRSREKSLRLLRTVRSALVAAAAAAVGVALFLSYAVARTVTRPLSTITGAMRDVAATGDLTRRIPPGGRWDDEDAKLLGRSFNTLAEAVARFQREAGLRERLSALGRLSTVVAHEVRNPLMIIRASLRTLRRASSGPPDVQEAIADIEHEVTRLDRIVGDVLDFARPPRLALAPVELASLCREAAEAAGGAEAGSLVEVTADAGLGSIVTDAERLRTVLVNLLTNAMEASRQDGGSDPTRIELRASEPRPGRILLLVRDRGRGIPPEALGHVFEPYFTTKRAGSGLGLAIAKNIVEALGGTIAVSSRAGEGTELRVEIPSAGPGAVR